MSNSLRFWIIGYLYQRGEGGPPASVNSTRSEPSGERNGSFCGTTKWSWTSTPWPTGCGTTIRLSGRSGGNGTLT